MRQFFKSGEPLIWLTGSSLALCLLMIAGLVGIVLYNGLGYFWPKQVDAFRLTDGQRVMGQIVGREETPDGGQRLQLKVGNRDVYGLDFRWVDEAAIEEQRRLDEVVVFERVEWGNMYGILQRLYAGEDLVAEGEMVWGQMETALTQIGARRKVMEELEQGPIGTVNSQLEGLRLKQRRLERQGAGPDLLAPVENDQKELWQRYEELSDQLVKLRGENEVYEALVVLADGEERRLKLADIVRYYQPNKLDLKGKGMVYLAKVWEFVAGEPRESNTEGGIFPALFGTVMMVMLMTVLVVPFGVLAALYLREYARQGAIVRAIRIAVNNLAGVPSIVFGMFGLGFFVYGVGGGIDRLFFADSLPTPTFGTGGILWASLTLALLTVPVVVVATEEALASVPRAVRDASLALGSTQFQMIWRVVLPSALPGILTGIILATARGAGEVAPLMITGVVKLAPDLPLDAAWPFFHLDRKFMHLGFHIYDVGFQSPNVEAARPMVYATTLLLLSIVLALNLTAIFLRNYLRKRYAASTF